MQTDSLWFLRAGWFAACALLPAACTSSGGSTDSGVDAAADVAVSPDAADAADAVDAVDARAEPDVVCTDCLTTSVRWAGVGGFDAGHDDWNQLDACRTYSLVTFTFATQDASAGCSHEIAACGADAAYGVEGVERALADPDVVAAFAQAPIVYGQDNRSGDQAIFAVTTPAGTIYIGDDCTAGAFQCTRPVPAGLTALRTYLLALGAQERQACDAGP